MTTIAVLPVKRLELAKQRLGGALREAQRRALAEAMATDVLSALTRCAGLQATAVVTADPGVTRLARAHGATVVADTRSAGQSAAAALGLAHALEHDHDRVLLVPGDCPALDPVEVEALLGGELADGPSVVIVPDRHGPGTNALLVQPPDVIAPSFGPGSFDRHQLAARAAGARVVIARPPSLLLDVDTAADLGAMAAALAGEPDLAPCTRAALADLDRAGAPVP